MSMKKAIILSICTLFLISCGRFQNNAGNDNPNTATDSAITGSSITTSAVSGGVVSTAAVSGAAMGKQEGRENEEKVKVRFVTDETGQKQKLRLGSVNEKDTGVYFKNCEEFVSLYSQVSDGHYYFLKANDNGGYTIYQDKDRIVGQISQDSLNSVYENEEYGTYFVITVSGFIKYGTEFYAILCVEYGDNYDYGNDYKYTYDLTHVNLETGGIEIIWNFSSGDNENGTGTDRIDYGRDIIYLALYKDKMYFMDADRHINFSYEETMKELEELQELTDEEREERAAAEDASKNFVKKDMANGCSETIMPSAANMDEAKPYLTIVDGKIYYGQQKGKKVTLYAYDLESYQEQKIFSYQRKQPYQGDYTWGRTADDVFLEIDEDYIYCQEFIIPRAGGEMIPVFRQAVVYEDGRLPYAHNKKYIFYIDKEYKLHRFSKKTKSDVIISDMKIMDVDCTEKNIYVKEYDKRYMRYIYEMEDDDTLPYDVAANVYCMDMDGEHVERIVKKVNG